MAARKNKTEQFSTPLPLRSRALSVAILSCAMLFFFSSAVLAQTGKASPGPDATIQGKAIYKDASAIAPAFDIGIDRSNLTLQHEDVRVKTIDGISSLGAAWYRGGHTGWGTLKDWIDVVRLAKQKNLKVLDVINASTDDWDDGRTRPAKNAGPDFTKHCGWQGGSRKLSQINLGKFASRLRAELDAVKGAGLTIDAFEVGNEYDWYCFNGDVPNGHEATQEEFMTAVRGYAHFLKTAAEVIHQYFPDARIITFGIAHGSDQGDKPPHHLSNPARMVAQLHSVDGYNYLDNSSYRVDGFGEHFYPSADTVGQWMQNTLHQDTAVLGYDKPLWITEWGLDSRRFPNKAGQSRAQAMAEFYTSLEKFKESKFTFGPVFYYSYADDGPAGGSALTDKAGRLLPDATEVVRHR